VPVAKEADAESGTPPAPIDGVAHFAIQDGIPIPGLRGRPGTDYPFAAMKPGQSFGFPLARIGSVYAAAKKFSGQQQGAKFCIRKIDAETARCWRVE
jgi:hypothetical protein